MIRLGIAVLLALVGIWALTGRERTTVEEAPVEEILATAAEAPEVSAQGDLASQDTAGKVVWDLRPAWNDRVEFWIDFLTGENRDKTRLWLERVGRYGPMIRAALRERGMPEDLLYLAMIESGLSPRAYSRANASGLWQFISETGRRYGLEVSGYVDERRDPIEATRAALDYLEDLYDQFGSWYLAAAAYNTGENRVERILRQRAGGARGDDALFWKIDQYLPRETRDYVPLMLAAGHIAKEPEKYGFKGLELQRPLRFDTVRVPGATSLRAVAKAAEVDYDVIKQLNPHLVRGTTPPDRPWAVRLPPGRRRVFANNFARMDREERMALLDHVVRRGETLSHIARRYGTTVRALQEANGWLDPRRLAVGQRIRVPVAGTFGRAEWRYYLVRRGDSLWAISRRYGVSVRQLQAWNDLGRRSRILPGQRLRIRT
ncbi:MAG TPA: LysM peptidoglycan-binding domain-containing protein [Longimicrobiales bacterium]